jgi:hypothetical protein
MDKTEKYATKLNMIYCFFFGELVFNDPQGTEFTTCYLLLYSFSRVDTLHSALCQSK